MKVSDPVIISGISTAGGVCIAYIANVIANRRKITPESRTNTIFDGYENLIRQQQLDIERKQAQLNQSQNLIDHLQQDLEETRGIVSGMQNQLEESRQDNLKLIEQLTVM